MIRAYRYGGLIYLKFGSKKTSPGVLYDRRSLETGERPFMELCQDGTITQHDRPEGVVIQMTRVSMPAWADKHPIKRFKSRS